MTQPSEPLNSPSVTTDAEPVVEPFAIPAVGVSTLLIRLLHYRLFIVMSSLLLGIGIGAHSALSPPMFTAYARLLPPQTNTATASSLLNQIGGAAALGSSALTLKNPSDLYASLFYSRSVQDNVIAHFELAKHYDQSDIDLLRSGIAKRTNVEVGKDGIIILGYTDESAQMAASIANGMLAAMYSIAKRLAKSESERRTDFYDTLIADSQKQLAQAIERLRQMEHETGLTRLKGQEESYSAALVELQGQIATREVELQKMALVATKYHPEVIRVKTELTALRLQLAKLSVGIKTPTTTASTTTSTSSRSTSGTSDKGLLIPFESYADSRALVEPLRREVDIHASVLEQLIKARALSKVDESRDFSVISILDDAVAPTRKSGPRVFVNAGVATLIGFLVATMLALMWDVLFTDPARRARWRQVFRAFTKRDKSEASL